MPNLELSSLVTSWRVHLQAERKSRLTIKSYVTGVTQYIEFCEREELPVEIDRDTVNAFVVYILEELGREATTAAARQLAVRLFSAWLFEEGETSSDPLLGLKAPSFDQKVTERLTEEQCSALIKACKGSEFRDRRDEALLRYMLEAIVRAGEVIGQSVSDYDLPAGLSRVLGKGRKERIVPFGPQTARALDRYLRLRRQHKLADTPAMWLGERGTGFGYQGLYSTLQHRARLAGIERFHPHLTRHTAAQRFLDAGGSEGSLMAIAGWSDRAMLDRYTKSTAVARAVAETRKLNLGDL